MQPGPGSERTLAELVAETMTAPPAAAPPTATPPTGQPAIGQVPTGQVPTGQVSVDPVPTDQVPVTDAVVGGGGPVKPSKPRRHRWLRRSVLGVAILLLLALAYYLVTLYQVWSTANQDQARPADAIVVLGAAQYDGRPAAVLASRLDHVLQLYKAGYADTIVVTGGKQPLDRFTEAAASAKYLEARGVPASAILEAPIGHNSFDSISAAAQLLKQRRKHTVLMVSDPYHSLRIGGIAEEVGLKPYTSPTRTSPITGASAFRRMMKEAAGISLARVIGYGRLKDLTG